MRRRTSSKVVRRCTAAVRITPQRRAGRSVGGQGWVQGAFQDVAGDRGDVRVGAVEAGCAGRDRQVAVEWQRLAVARAERVAQADGQRAVVAVNP